MQPNLKSLTRSIRLIMALVETGRGVVVKLSPFKACSLLVPSPLFFVTASVSFILLGLCKASKCNIQGKVRSRSATKTLNGNEILTQVQMASFSVYRDKAIAPSLRKGKTAWW